MINRSLIVRLFLLLFFFFFNNFCETCSKIVELEEELRVVGNNLKSLEVSEEKVWPFLYISVPIKLPTDPTLRENLTVYSVALCFWSDCSAGSSLVELRFS